jgi:hypothetical protein
MGRLKRWHEDMLARFPKGTFARMNAVMDAAEDRTAFVRAAVERELQRREPSTPPAPWRMTADARIFTIGKFTSRS